MRTLRWMIISGTCVLLNGPVTHAAQINQLADDALGISSFQSGTNWSDGLTPHSGGAYVTAHTLRTPAVGAITFAGTSLQVNPGGVLAYNGTPNGYVQVNSFVLNGGGLSQWRNYYTGHIEGDLTISADSYFSTVPYATLRVDAPLSGSGALLVFSQPGVTGIGTVVVDNANASYTGNITIATNGYLWLGRDVASAGLGSGNITNNGILVVSPGSSLSNNMSICSVAGATLDFSLVSGGYTLINGQLLRNDATIAGILHVGAGATLGGTGSTSSATVENAGHLSGSPLFNTLTLSTGAFISNSISSPSIYDAMTATNLTVNGSINWDLQLQGSSLPAQTTLELFDVGNYVGGSTTAWLSLGGTNLLHEGDVFALPNTGGSNDYFRISYAGGTGNSITLTVIPEPVSVSVLLLGCGLLVFRSRWKNR